MHCLEIGQMYSPKINCFYFPYHNTGAHFVNWSTYYLAGKNYYLTRENNYKSLILPDQVDYQLKNFHHHRTARANGYASVIDFLGADHQNPHTDMINLYLVSPPLFEHQPTTIEEKSQGLLSENINKRHKNRVHEMSKALDYVQEHGCPVIMCRYHDDDFLSVFYNDRSPTSLIDGRCFDTIDDARNEWESVFFAEAGQYFDDNIWDRREKMALTIRPWSGIRSMDQSFNTVRPHLMYNTDDIWNDLPNVILEIIDFIGSEMQAQRWDAWLAVYNHWRRLHDQSFSRNFKLIVDSIVNNRYMSLKRYNMTFYKEVLIQHALIFHYNLNLKTWQLSRFPDNTQDLHSLLETNIHLI